MTATGDTVSSERGLSAPLSASAAMALSALGIVFGDIGTSPLYTLKTVLAVHGDEANRFVALGSLSLIFWTLTIITSIKYVLVAMRIDNDGEGGIMALMALLAGHDKKRVAIIAFGLFGAALIYGDGAITPAISVLSALEGLSILTARFDPYILPLTIVILVALFLFQSKGTARIGRLFGPVMAVWFVVIGALGIWGIAQNPSVLAALNPLYGLHYLFSGGLSSFLVLGAVFLCVTGAEALYADMGHFGRHPIQLAWAFVVFPCLVLNYAGQTALVLNGTPITGNIFYALCPQSLLAPFVVLATVATIIASQSIITGAFSMTRQAIQLGWLPRLRIKQTSAEGYGQIYVGAVNWLLMIVTLGLTVIFRKSDNLAAAYGIAVSATMLMTTVLLFMAMRQYLKWSLPIAAVVAGSFLIVDSAFFLSNAAKIAEGGYVPLALAAFVYGAMWIWHSGRDAMTNAVTEAAVPVQTFLAEIAAKHVPRVPGSAVFMSRSLTGAPPVMVWHVKHSRSLHEKIMVVNVKFEPVPWIADEDRLSLIQEAPDFYRAIASFGFMERPDIPAVLRQSKEQGCDILTDDITYYVGHETPVRREDGEGLPKWRFDLFAFMDRNSAKVTDFFRLPRNDVVEIGRDVEI